MGKNSESNFERAQKVMPGGVNSPVRAFKAVGGTPIFIDQGQGSRIFDVDPDNVSIELLQAGQALAAAEPWASMENVGEW